MKENKKWLSIIFTMIFVILITFLVIYILEYMIPFWRDVKWIEQSSKAYYEANKWVEDWLFYARENKLQDWSAVVWNYEYRLAANTDGINKTLPFLWKWNSDYDKDFNIINFWNPVQMDIWNWAIGAWTWANVNLYIRAPDIDGLGNNIFTGSTVLVTWRLSSVWWVLAWNLSASSPTEVYNNRLWNLSWKELDWSLEDLDTYYNSNCWAWADCTLKLSVVNEFKSASWTVLPYLEWNIDFDSNIVPTRFFRINTSGKSWPFMKNLEVQKPQQTVIEAFDFTIIQ